jgi:hypothetical protein
LQVVTPNSCEKRQVTGVAKQKFSLLIGKKRINLYFGSGILDASCVKIYEESYITLPGGFQLPIAFVTESWIPSQTETVDTDGEELSDAAKDYLLGEMTAGTILNAKEEIEQGDGRWILSGRYACTELIGQLREEEIVKPNGTND